MAKEILRRYRQIKKELDFFLSDNGFVSSLKLESRDPLTDFRYHIASIVANKVLYVEFPDKTNFDGDYVMFRNQIANFIRNEFYDDIKTTFLKTEFMSSR